MTFKLSKTSFLKVKTNWNNFCIFIYLVLINLCNIYIYIYIYIILLIASYRKYSRLSYGTPKQHIIYTIFQI